MAQRWGVIITYRGIHSGQTAVRKFRAILRNALRVAVTTWWKQMLPKRFLAGARTEFGFTPRAAGYDDFKTDVQGGRISKWKGVDITPFWVARQQPRDNVLSGATQRESKSVISVGGTYKKATGRFRVPFGFSVGQKGKQRLAELLTLSHREAKVLAVLVDKRLGRDLNADQTVERKTIMA